MEWKKIPGYDRYEINELGEVKSLTRNDGAKILKPMVNSPGSHPYVKLWKNQKSRSIKVVDLMIRTFALDIKAWDSVGYYDGNRENVKLSNLFVRKFNSAANLSKGVEIQDIFLRTDGQWCSKWVLENGDRVDLIIHEKKSVCQMMYNWAGMEEAPKRINGELKKTYITLKDIEEEREKLLAEYPNKRAKLRI